MTDLSFHCPHCERKLSAAEDMEGTTISCPSCKNTLAVPIRIIIPVETATDTEETHGGEACPYCRVPFNSADSLKVCPSCATSHHAECWIENKGCTVFGCPEAAQDDEKVAVSLPSGTATPSVISNHPKKNAPGATSSLVWGILGFFICGLIFGIVAISNANKAKKLIQAQPDIYTGEGLATAGLVIGIIDLVVWGLIMLTKIAGAGS